MVGETHKTAMVPRPPLKAIRVLLPVWGRAHVQGFLDYGLPSLLAEGNLPALGAHAPTTFVLQTRRSDAALVESHPAWMRLRGLCAVEIDPIDDLVSAASGVVLTLAYARAIRAVGDAGTDTCFVLLVGDYVMAAGSLKELVTQVERGADGVLTGNFQVTAETAGPALCAARHGDVLTMAPRNLIRLGLAHLHKYAQAAIVDGAGPLERRTNRLFWRSGAEGLLGRFWLMHMAAIRPERTGFTVAGPSDYALIPELCPSGRIERITDSDTYAVLELLADAPAQKGSPMNPAAMAAAVQPWATALHRENAETAVFFHAGAAFPGNEIADSNAFVADVARALNGPPQPHRHHPFWAPMLDHHATTAVLPVDFARLAAILGEAPETQIDVLKQGRARRVLLGRGAALRPWHPRWADLRALRAGLHAAELAGHNLLLVGDFPAAAMGLVAAATTVTRLSLEDVLADTETTRFERITFFCRNQSEVSPEHLSAAARRLTADGVLLLSIGEVFSDEARSLAADAEPTIPTLQANLRIAVPAGRARLALQNAMMALARSGRWRLFSAAGLALPSALLNLLAWHGAAPSMASSLVLTYRPTVASASAAAPSRSARRALPDGGTISRRQTVAAHLPLWRSQAT